MPIHRFSSRMPMRIAALRLFAAAAIVALATPPVRAQISRLGEVEALPTSSGILVNNGLAVDMLGNVYSSDYNTNVINVVDFQGDVYPLKTTGYTLSNPNGVAIDPAGNVYICDSGNNRVLEVAPGGATTVLSTTGFTLNNPSGIALDALGEIFIADTGNSRILRLSPALGNKLIPIAPYSAAGTQSLAVTQDGNTLYFSNPSNNFNYIVKVSNLQQNNPQASLLPSPAGLSPNTFSLPMGLALDRSGDLFIVDTYNARVLELAVGGGYSVVAQSSSSFVIVRPSAVAVDSGGTVYFADPFADHIGRAVSSSVNFGPVDLGLSSNRLRNYQFTIGVNSTLKIARAVTSGVANTEFWVDGGTCIPGTTATVCTVQISFTPTQPGPRSGVLQMIDTNNQILASVPLYGIGIGSRVAFPLATAAKVSAGTYIYVPRSSITPDEQGNLYIADKGSNRVLKVGPGGTTQLSTGTLNLTLPAQVVLDGAGNLYIADSGNDRIVEVPAVGAPFVLTTGGLALHSPEALAFDAAGNLFIADAGNSRFVAVPVSGPPYVVPAGGNFSAPTSMAIDTLNNIYFVQSGAAGLWEIPWGGKLTQISTAPYTPMGSGGLTVDASGTIYLVDQDGARVLAIAPSGSITIVPTTGVKLSDPGPVAVDSLGNLFISDDAVNTIVRIPRATVPSLQFADTVAGMIETQGPQNFELLNNGNVGWEFSDLSFPVGFPEMPAASPQCTVNQNILAGGICDLSVTFTPYTAKIYSGNIGIKFYQAPVALVHVPVSGKGVSGQLITFNLSPSTAVYGAAPVTLTATATSGLPVRFNVLSGPGTITGNSLKITGAGSIVIVANQPGNSTMPAAPQVTQTLTVSPAPITVVPAAASGTYGVAPNLTGLGYSLTGFVNGDTSSVVTGTAAFTTTATAASPAGSYPLTYTLGSLTAKNYNFSGAGVYLVNKAQLTVTASLTFVYGSKTVARPQVKYAGFVNGDTASVLSGAPTFTTTATLKSPVGSYPLKVLQGTLTAANYTFKFAGGSVVITPARLIFKASNVTWKRGSTTGWVLTYTVTGLVNGDTNATAFGGKPSLGTAATKTSPAGNYPITIAATRLLQSANYTFTFVNGVLTITN